MAPKPIIINKIKYYNAFKLQEYDPSFFCDCKGVREIIDIKKIAKENYTYGTKHAKKGWTLSDKQNNPPRKATLLLKREWVLNNMQSMKKDKKKKETKDNDNSNNFDNTDIDNSSIDNNNNYNRNEIVRENEALKLEIENLKNDAKQNELEMNELKQKLKSELEKYELQLKNETEKNELRLKAEKIQLRNEFLIEMHKSEIAMIQMANKFEKSNDQTISVCAKDAISSVINEFNESQTF
jgi:hypothetical protein